MSIEQAFATGFGILIGCFTVWLILPWVYSWRRRKVVPVENHEGPDTFAWQDGPLDQDLAPSRASDSHRQMRTGRKLGRTLYLKGDTDDYQHDKVIGIVDTVWLANEICRRWNMNIEKESNEQGEGPQG